MVKRKIKRFYTKHERFMSPLAFFVGFLWDSFTLRRIDLWLENIVFLVYLFAAAGVIILLNTRFSPAYRQAGEKYASFLPVVLQFVFGALFSAFFIFYSRSASLATSWPFMLFLLGLLLGNEFFRKRYHQLTFQLSIFFVVLFSYSIFSVPVLLGKMGSLIFILSGFLSLALIGLVIFILSRVIHQEVVQRRQAILFSILGVYLAFNFLYFTNTIPPIPLSLKDIGVYHFVERTKDLHYIVYDEDSSWPHLLKKFDNNINWVPGTPVYVFSAIFAPTKISVEIFHKWSYFDEEKGEWVTASRIGFLIAGGRDGGYRGYSVKSSIWPGKWRVDVLTDRGQLLGRVNFKIKEAETLPKLEIKIK